MKSLIKKLLREGLEESGKKYPTIPSLVYHGQPPKYNGAEKQEPVKFDKFSLDDKRFLKDGNHGFYFTADKYEAIDYAEGGNVYTCTLNINNPYYYEAIYAYTDKGFIKSANFISTSDYNKLINAGYDGVVLLTVMNKLGEIIALHPEQIKIIGVESAYDARN